MHVGKGSVALETGRGQQQQLRLHRQVHTMLTAAAVNMRVYASAGDHRQAGSARQLQLPVSGRGRLHSQANVYVAEGLQAGRGDSSGAGECMY